MVRSVLWLLVALLVASPAWAYRFAAGTYTVGASPADDRQIDISDTSVFEDFTPVFVAVKCNAAQYGVFNSTGSDLSNYFTFSSGDSANGIQSFNANGFVVGTLANVQPANSTCFYLALASDGVNTDFAVGTYSGTGADNRTIDISDTSSPASADFQPELVLLKNYNGVEVGELRLASMAGDLSCPFTSTACGADRIQSLVSNGFTVGTSNAVNQNLEGYRYMALKLTGQSKSGTYTGNGLDNRDYTLVGFSPQWLLVKGAGQNARQRFLDHAADASSRFTNTADAADEIQAFLSNGMTLGANASVNQDTTTYYWYALRAAGAARRLRFIW